MRGICKILNHCWNVLGCTTKTYDVEWSAPTTIKFIGGIIKVQYITIAWARLQQRIQYYCDSKKYSGDGIETNELSWPNVPPGTPRPTGNTIRCNRGVKYLEVNGTVIFDNR